MLRPDLAGRVSGIGDVARAGLRVVNREPGSEARRVLDRELARHGIDSGEVCGYGTSATGHLQVASAIAAGLADAGVAASPLTHRDFQLCGSITRLCGICTSVNRLSFDEILTILSQLQSRINQTGANKV